MGEQKVLVRMKVRENPPKKRSFVYTIGRKKTKYGAHLLFRVWEITNGKAEYIGKVEADSQSYPGDDAMAWKVIVDSGVLPKTMMKKIKKEGSVYYTGYKYGVALQELGCYI